MTVKDGGDRNAIAASLLMAAALPLSKGTIKLESILREINIDIDPDILNSEPPAVVASFILGHLSLWPDAMVAASYALRESSYRAMASELFQRAREKTLALSVRLCQFGHVSVARTLLQRSMDIQATLPNNLSAPLTLQRGLLELLDFHDAALRNRARPFTTVGRPHLIDLPVWGEWFINKAGDRILPTLLAPGNVPKLAEFGTVIICIHCHRANIDQLQSLPALQALASYARIELIPLPDSIKTLTTPGLNRLIITVARHSSLLLARSLGADYSAATADMLCSENFYGECKKKLLEGWKVICDYDLRVVDEQMENQIATAGLLQDGVLCLPAPWLYRAGFRALHPFVRGSFMRAEPGTLPVNPIVFYTRSEEGFLSHSFQYFLTAVAADAIPEDDDAYMDLYTPDVRMLSDILHHQDTDRVCFIDPDPPGDRYMVHVDTANSINQFNICCSVTPEDSASDALGCAVRPWDRDHFEWSVRQRIHFRLPPDMVAEIPLPDSLSEAQAVDRGVAALHALWPARLQDIERFRHLAAMVSAPLRRRR